jgi:hypothetical protein
MSNLRLINETSFTDVSSVNIENVFSADFDIYKLTLDIGKSSGGVVSVEHRLINAAGSVVSASNYDFVTLKLDSGGSFATNDRATNSNDIRGLGQVGTDVNTHSDSAVAYYFDPFKSTCYTFLTMQSSYFADASPDRHFGYKGAAVLKQAASMSGINIFSTSGNYTGTAKIYGLRVDV